VCGLLADSGNYDVAITFARWRIKIISKHFAVGLLFILLCKSRSKNSIVDSDLTCTDLLSPRLLTDRRTHKHTDTPTDRQTDRQTHAKLCTNA